MTTSRGVPVKIDDIIFGENLIDRDPNPVKITYRKSFNIVVHDTLPKPKTQCTQPYGLWTLTIEVETTTEEMAKRLASLNAGPYVVVTDLLPDTPFYIRDIRAIQEPGYKDNYQWIIELIEMYD